MCIFSQPVTRVTNTNIFSRMSGDGWQYLVYQMNYQTEEVNAMILPLPVSRERKADESLLKFISLEEYESFFSDLNRGFPVMRTGGPARGGIDSIKASNKLVVEEVGNFVASFVPTMKDFSRLDERFVIPQESWEKIPRYSDYGFAVFQLKELAGKPHPMAFKFRTRFDDQVFFPTVHIHDGEVYEREAFDHTLYLQDEHFDSACGAFRRDLSTDPQTNYVRSFRTAGKFSDIENSREILDADLLVHRREMRGEFENVDIVARLDRLDDQGVNLSGVEQLALPATAAIGVAGIGWFFDRRNRVMKLERSSD